ncbi:hypothetical protein BCV70DRAFT_19105 [Testicularia cyperi]|uniref:Uncharacterized protein n=1 Tax=Testicularia cyperi TaxID=1882483 RepID=A0A317Y0F4_9BASI|nr:hypothetical protein BCV70DRAFT_19105 [Testicularia cyperi]
MPLDRLGRSNPSAVSSPPRDSSSFLATLNTALALSSTPTQASTSNVASNRSGSALATPAPPGSFSPARHGSSSSTTRARRQSASHHRHHSAESIRLDLDGLDLGGNSSNSLDPFDEGLVDPFARARHFRSQSGAGTMSVHTDLRQWSAAAAPADRMTETDPSSSVDKGLNFGEDSFSAHLRAECCDYREILSSNAALNAAVDDHAKLHAHGDHLGTTGVTPLNCKADHGQVLGAFASLGMQSETEASFTKYRRQSARRSVTKESTESSDAPLTPRDWNNSPTWLRDEADRNSAAPRSPTRWAYLGVEPGNALESLDTLSVEDMGFHSLDMGSFKDWEGFKLSAEILCPVHGHLKLQWSIAQTTRRSKKWVIVPNEMLACGAKLPLSTEEQSMRSMVVGERSLWTNLGQIHQPQLRPRTFSGRAGFEIRSLRAGNDSNMASPVYLANPSTHRTLHSFRTGIDTPLTTVCGSIVEPRDLTSDNTFDAPSQPIYPILRRSRSRPYLRTEHVPLRRSRSKPYLRYSVKQQSSLPGSRGSAAPEFAPSLPGDPLIHSLPGESWPSARSPHSDSLSSLGSNTSSSERDSDLSSGGQLALVNSRDSTLGNPSLASFNAGSAGSSADPTKTKGRSAMRRFRPIRPPANDNGRDLRPAESSGELSPRSFSRPFASPGSETASSVSGRRSQREPSDNESRTATSPTTLAMSASSGSSSSKPAKRKGLQRALQKKDKMLNSWFKKKPVVAASLPAFAGTPSVGQLVFSPPSLHSPRWRASGPPSTSPNPALGGFSTPLTENALEQLERAMRRPGSPESTIMGSRRGSEALTQKTVEPTYVADPTDQIHDRLLSLRAGDLASLSRTEVERSSPANASRAAITTTLAEIYGWDSGVVAGKTIPRSSALTPQPSFVTQTGTSARLFQDLDEEQALLGLDSVPPEAMTMLIPLPLLGRKRAAEAVRYMRVNFVPFRRTETASTSGMSIGSSTVSSSISETPKLERDESMGATSSSSQRDLVSSSAKAGESNWKRKLGLSSSSSRASHIPVTTTAALASGPQPVKMFELPSPVSPTASPLESFRVTAVVLDAPWTPAGAKLDPRIPEAGAFPTVLGYCNGLKSLEMINEGWVALQLGGHIEPINEDGSPLDGPNPLQGVSDMIIAAATAVMDI